MGKQLRAASKKKKPLRSGKKEKPEWWRDRAPAAAGPAPAIPVSAPEPWAGVGPAPAATPWGPAAGPMQALEVLGPPAPGPKPLPSPLSAALRPGTPYLPTVMRPSALEQAAPAMPVRGVPPSMMRPPVPGAQAAPVRGVTPVEARPIPPPVWATGERAGKQFRAPWEEVGAPVEGLDLPGAWGKAQAPAVPVAEISAQPGTPEWVAARSEQLEAERAEGVKRMGDVAVAAYHDVQQVPFLGKVVRGAEALASNLLTALQVPGWMVEEEIGTEITQQMAGDYSMFTLTPAQHLTEEQQALAQRAADETGKPLFLVEQVLLAEERRGQPSIQEYATAQYGESEEVQIALQRLGLGLGYSSREAQVAGLDRLMAGEDLEAVVSGRRVNTFEPSEEDVAAFQAYVEGIRAREGDDAATAAGQRVVETGFIPGESDLANEMIFQIGLDPLNLLDIGVWKRGWEARKARAAGKFATQAAGYADELAAGTMLAVRHGQDAAQAAGHADEAENLGMLGEMFARYNPLAPTERAAAEMMAGTTYQVVSPAVMQVESADEAQAMVKALAADPQRLAPVLGNVPVSEAAAEAGPLLQQVVGDLDDAKLFPSLRSPEFDRMAFLADLDEALILRALEMTGASEKTLSGYQKFASGFKSVMSEAYLRTPGYATRNAQGDLVTMAWDGLLSLDGRSQIDDFLARFGPTTRRVGGAPAGSQVLTGEGSVLPGMLGRASGGLGQWIGAQEESRYLRAFYTGLQKATRRVWKPTLPAELADLLSPGAAEAIERGLAGSVNADEMAEVIARATGAEAGALVDVGRFLDDPDDVSVGLRLYLETELAGAAGVERVDEVLDAAQGLARDNAAKIFGSDPTPPGRRVWSDVEAVQDLKEEQAWLGGLGEAMGVAEDEVAQAGAALADGLRPGELEIRQAEEALAAAVGGQFDEDAANLMRTVRAETGRANIETRSAADALRAEAWQQAAELREAGRQSEAGMVWQTYFAEVEQLHRQNQAGVLTRLQGGLDDLARMRAGESFEQVIGRPAQQIVDESLMHLRAAAADVAGRQARVKRLGLEKFADFDNALDAQRLTVDVAEAEAWRLVAINPGRDGLDIVTSTQEGVDRLARAAAAEAGTVRMRMLGRAKPKIGVAEYHELVGDIWQTYFRNASQGWDLARWELAQLPLSPQAQTRALAVLGWPADEVAKLAPEALEAALGAGVRWDPLMGGPVLALDEAMRGTAWEVAQQAGLDLRKSADWGPAEWRQFSQTAAGLGNEAGGRASLAGRVTTSAAEVTAEAAAAAPKSAVAGMELAWPSNVDDVARTMGIRPQTAGADEWSAVAQYAEEQGQAGRLLGDPYGRQSLAAAEAERLPEEAAAYRWMELAEEARARAAGGAGTIAPPGLYDAAGFPVARAGPGRVRPQREIIEGAGAMVPEAERLGRARATVGFEERQVWLSQQYQNMGDMGRARAGLLEEGRRMGEAVDVPVGVTKASTRKEASIYLLDMIDDDNRVICTYAYETWPEARAARDQAREVITAGRQGQGAAVGTAWNKWGTADVVAADRRAVAAGGYAGPPVMADAAALVEQQELAALDRIREGLRAEWAAPTQVGEVSPAAQNQLMQWVKGDLAREWNEARTVAVEMAREAANHALLDYSGGRKRFDDWLQLVFPYTYWKTRSGRNWLLRFAERPGALAAYTRYKQGMERVGAERGYRSRFGGKIEISVPWMPEWTGQAVLVDPASLFMPWTQILGPDWGGDPGEAENFGEAMYRVSQRLGLRPYGFIEWPMQYMNWAGQEREEMGYVLPHTGAIQAVTAAAGIGPPGGVSIERGLRKGLGLPEQEPYGAYRVLREVGNMAQEDPSLAQQALVAQELQRLVETGELRQEEAMGWQTGLTPAVLRVGRDMGWTEEQLEEAQTLLQEATRRAGLERGLAAGSSFFTGVGLSMYPAGEREQLRLEQEQRGVQYSPLTERGSRAEMLQWRKEHPETIPRRLARSALPGAGEYEGWTPGEAWGSQEYHKRADEIDSTYDEAIDALLQKEPWNRQGVRELEEQRRSELDVLRDELGQEWDEEAGYRPRSVYGASPEEAAEIRREEVLSIVSGAMPKTAQFKDEAGEVDYEAYESAVDSFFESLPENLAGDERLAAVAAELGGVVGADADRGDVRPGLPVLPVREERVVLPEDLLAGIDREAVEAYWRRNDQPLEAAQSVWEEAVYGPAWEAYNRAVDGGMDKGEAYERYVEGAGIDADTLVAQIMEAYPGRWTDKELRKALRGVEFPSAAEVSLLRKPEAEQEMSRAQGAFWDFLNEGLPPGRMASGARDHTLVQLVLDAETRGTATAEQYQQALEFMQGWAAENRAEETWGTAKDWAAARELNDEFQQVVEERWPRLDETLNEYYSLSQSERRAYKNEHPEIGQYYDARDEWGAEAGHEVWARYYLKRGAAGTAAAGGAPYWGVSRRGRSRRSGWGGRSRRRGGGRRYGGRRRRRDPDWQFGYQARRVPRTFLETPSPWKGKLSERFERYYAEGTPWVVGRWKKW